jgi:hypothetical protein
LAATGNIRFAATASASPQARSTTSPHRPGFRKRDGGALEVAGAALELDLSDAAERTFDRDAQWLDGDEPPRLPKVTVDEAIRILGRQTPAGTAGVRHEVSS